MSKKGIHINKQRWKIFLAFMVLIVIAGTLLLSNGFISKIGQREKDKAEQWAQSVKKKGELVKLSDQIFQELKKKEKQKIDLVLDAYRIVLRPTDDLTLNIDKDFADSIINSNKDIPVILIYSGSNQPIYNEGMNQFFNEIKSDVKKDSISIDQAIKWSNIGQCDTIPVMEGWDAYFFYGNSSKLKSLRFRRPGLSKILVLQ